MDASGYVSGWGFALKPPEPGSLDEAFLVTASGQRIAVGECWTHDEICDMAACSSREEMADTLRPTLAKVDAKTGQSNLPEYLAFELRRLLHRVQADVPEIRRMFEEWLIVPQLTADGRVAQLLCAGPEPVAEEHIDELVRAGALALHRVDFAELQLPALQPTRDLLASVRRLASQVVLPPGRTARNTEVVWMQIGWLTSELSRLGPGVMQWAWLEGHLGRAGGLVELFHECHPLVRQWYLNWADHGFPRLEVSHRLAAALALTDAPAETRAPWPAFMVALPDGLFSPFSRISCSQREDSPLQIEGLIRADGGKCEAGDPDWPNDEQLTLLDNFVRSLCLALEEKPKPTGHYSCSAHGAGRRGRRVPGIHGAKFVVGRPVTIDLRDELARVWEGRTRRAHGGGAPRVQFLVRGHWRNQAHGEGRALRKRIWIEPFWKGPEEARILLRTHAVEKGDSQ